jgi:outer membrane protein, heavy metal efflux system
MKKFYIKIAVFIFPFIHAGFLFGQTGAVHSMVPLTLNSFLSEVSSGNLGYIAGRLNVSISEAELAASKVFPDPVISLAYSNNDDKKMMMGQSADAALSYPLSLGNKRGASVSLAGSQLELSRLVLDAWFQNLRADAAKAYFSALKDLKLYELGKETLDQLKKLARADSLRLLNGEGSNIDALQSSLEARAFLGTLYQYEAAMQNSSVELIRTMGRKPADTLAVPSDDFPAAPGTYQLDKLISTALQSRTDLLIAIKNREISEKNLALIRAQRAPELNISAGFSHNYIANNNIAPAPAYNAITAGIDFPIKFSGLNRGQVSAAKFAVRQSEVYGNDAENQVRSEVYRAYNNYVACGRKLELYKSGMVSDAEKILQGRIYAYQRGETALVDVISARRTYTELSSDYIDALFEYASALIDLEHSAGIWDITK